MECGMQKMFRFLRKIRYSIRLTDNELGITSVMTAFLLFVNYQSIFSAALPAIKPYMLAAQAAVVIYAAFVVKRRWGSFLIGRPTPRQSRFLLLYALLALSIVVSEIMSGQILESLSLVLFVPVFFFYLLPKFERPLMLFSIAGLISALPLMLIGYVAILADHEFSSNSIGLVIAFGTICLMSLAGELLARSRVGLYALSHVVILLNLAALLQIHSRTSILITLAAYSVMLLHDAPSLRAIPSARNLFRIVAVFAVVGVVFLIVDRGADLLSYFVSKSAGGDISSRRFYIWGRALEEFQLLGVGPSFFVDRQLLGPHNFLIGILTHGGFMGVAVLVVLMLSIAFDLLARSSDSLLVRRNIIIILIGFFVGGIFEGSLVYPFESLRNMVLFAALGTFYFAMPRRAEPGKSRTILGQAADVEVTTGADDGVHVSLLVAVASCAVIGLIALASMVFVGGAGNIGAVLRQGYELISGYL